MLKNRDKGSKVHDLGLSSNIEQENLDFVHSKAQFPRPAFDDGNLLAEACWRRIKN
jgi:hypothetical protein